MIKSFAKSTSRLLAALAATIFIAAVMLAPAAFADTSGYVIDEYGLLSASDEQALESTASSLANRYNVPAYIMICDSVTGTDRRNYAEDKWESYGLGTGSGADGIMFMIAMGSRDYVTITHGAGITVFTDYQIGVIEDEVVPKLSDGDYYDAFSTYLDKCSYTMDFYDQNGYPIDIDNDPGSAGERLLYRLIGSLVFALIVMVIVLLVLKSQLKSVKAGHEASAYQAPGGTNITGRRDEFRGTTVTKTPKPEKSSGGSSVDSRGFGGSSGGKF